MDSLAKILNLLTALFVIHEVAGSNVIFELNVWNNPIPEHGTHFRNNFLVPENSTLNAALKQAAKKSSDFSFETKFFNGMGNYIVSVNEVAEVPSQKKYWMIYKLSSFANVKSPPSKTSQIPKGIDQTKVSNRDIYLLWLQQFD